MAMMRCSLAQVAVASCLLVFLSPLTAAYDDQTGANNEEIQTWLESWIQQYQPSAPADDGQQQQQQTHYFTQDQVDYIKNLLNKMKPENVNDNVKQEIVEHFFPKDSGVNVTQPDLQTTTPADSDETVEDNSEEETTEQEQQTETSADSEEQVRQKPYTIAPVDSEEQTTQQEQQTTKPADSEEQTTQQEQQTTTPADSEEQVKQEPYTTAPADSEEQTTQQEQQTTTPADSDEQVKDNSEEQTTQQEQQTTTPADSDEQVKDDSEEQTTQQEQQTTTPADSDEQVKDDSEEQTTPQELQTTTPADSEEETTKQEQQTTTPAGSEEETTKQEQQTTKPADSEEETTKQELQTTTPADSEEETTKQELQTTTPADSEENTTHQQQQTTTPVDSEEQVKEDSEEQKEDSEAQKEDSEEQKEESEDDDDSHEESTESTTLTPTTTTETTTTTSTTSTTTTTEVITTPKSSTTTTTEVITTPETSTTTTTEVITTPETSTTTTTEVITTPETSTTTTTEPEPTTTTTSTTTTESTTAFTPSLELCNDCVVHHGVGYASFPGYCDAYVQCRFYGAVPTAVNIRRCPSGSYWNQGKLTCDFEANVKCTPVNNCPNHKAINGDWAAYLIYNGQNWTRESCPEGRTYNSVTCGCTDSHGDDDGSYENCYDKKAIQGDKTGYLQFTGNGWVRMACPATVGYNEQTCRCTDTLSTDTTISACPNMKPIPGDKSGFLQFTGVSWISRPCPATLVYNPVTCGCTYDQTNAVDDGKTKQDRLCKATVALNFDSNDTTDSSNNHFWVNNTGVTFNDGKAYFNGKSRLTIPGLSNMDFGSTVYILIKYRHSSANSKQTLVANGDCQVRQSLAVCSGKDSVDFYAETKQQISVGKITVPTDIGAWQYAVYALDNGSLTGSVGANNIAQPVKGALDRRQRGLVIGGGGDCDNFHGIIDEVQVFLCKPEL